MVLYYVAQAVLAASASRTALAALRSRARRPVLGHERLRPSSSRAFAGSASTGAGFARRCSSPSGTCSSCAAGRPLARAAAQRRAAIARRRGALAIAARLRVFAGAGASSSTTPTSSTRTRRRRTESGSARATRRTTRPTRELPQPRIIGGGRELRHLPETQRAESRGHLPAHATRARSPSRRCCSTCRPPAGSRRSRSSTAWSETARDDTRLGYCVVRRCPSRCRPGAEARPRVRPGFEPRGFAHGGAEADDRRQRHVRQQRHPARRSATRTTRSSSRTRSQAVRARAEGAHGAAATTRRRCSDNYIRQDSDFISFEATVSTSPDQIAIAPGYLEQEWTENGRRYFRYKMDQPILNFFSVLSARYEVKRDEWQRREARDLPPPGAHYNLDRMMARHEGRARLLLTSTSARTSTGRRASSSSRATQTFAQSFPNTIPYSEAIGFIARVRDDDPDDVDYPYYVTAHEIAHQWWAHQVVGANVRGATMTSETMAQYSALMVMKQKYGKREDAALPQVRARPLPRAAARRAEEGAAARPQREPAVHPLPEGQPGHVRAAGLHRRGAREPRAREGRGRSGVQGPAVRRRRRTSSTPSARRRRRSTQYLIDDLFETITLYDNRAVSATMRAERPTGTLDVDAEGVREEVPQRRQGRADGARLRRLDRRRRARREGHGARPREAEDQEGRLGDPLHRAEKPAKVGIDPLNKLDRPRLRRQRHRSCRSRERPCRDLGEAVPCRRAEATQCDQAMSFSIGKCAKRTRTGRARRHPARRKPINETFSPISASSSCSSPSCSSPSSSTS